MLGYKFLFDRENPQVFSNAEVCGVNISRLNAVEDGVEQKGYLVKFFKRGYF